MLKPVDKQRLEKLKSDLRLLNLRFPIAELSTRLHTNKGNLSAYLNGKKPVSDQFLKKFYDAFKEDLEVAATLALQAAAKAEADAAATAAAAPPEDASRAFAAPPFKQPGTERGVLESIQYQLYVITDMLNTVDLQQKSLNTALTTAGVLGGEEKDQVIAEEITEPGNMLQEEEEETDHHDLGLEGDTEESNENQNEEETETDQL